MPAAVVPACDLEGSADLSVEISGLIVGVVGSCGLGDVSAVVFRPCSVIDCARVGDVIEVAGDLAVVAAIPAENAAVVSRITGVAVDVVALVRHFNARESAV